MSDNYRFLVGERKLGSDDERMKKFQLGPDGKPLSARDFHFYDEQGYGKVLTRFQTEHGINSCRAVIRAALIKFVEDIVKVNMAPSERLHSIEERGAKILQQIDKLYEESPEFRTIFNTDKKSLEEFASTVNGIAGVMIKSNKSGEYNFGKTFEKVVAEKIYNKGFVKQPKDIIKQSEFHDYEQKYHEFTRGIIIPVEGQEDIYQYGMNEAQDLVKTELKCREANIKQLRADLEKSIAEGNKLSQVDTNDYPDRWRDVFTKRHNAALEANKKKTESLYNEFAETEKWRELFNYTEDFRNEGVKLKPEELAVVWQPFLDKFNEKEFNGTLYTRVAPPIQLEYAPPAIKLANFIGKIIGVEIVDPGIKSWESLLRKLQSSKFKEDGTSAVYDSIRNSTVFNDFKNIRRYRDGYADIMLTQVNTEMESFDFVLSKSMLLSAKESPLVKVKVPNEAGFEQEYGRVGEAKYYSYEQHKTKQLADKPYHITRLMNDETKKSKSNIRDTSNPENSARIEKAHSEITLFLNDSTIKAVIAKFNVDFGYDVNNLEEFSKQENFTSTAKQLDKVEQYINLYSLSKDDMSVRKIAYNALMKQRAKDYKGKPEESGNPLFSEEEVKIFESTVFNSDELKQVQHERAHKIAYIK